LLLENPGSSDQVARDPGPARALEAHQRSSPVRRRMQMDKASPTATRTDFLPLLNPLNAVRKICATIARYDNAIGRAVRASHDYQLLWHQSDEELARCGLSRREVARTIFTKHFSSDLP
jgi:hypothetical protein